jgi:signal transduction histidine kinase
MKLAGALAVPLLALVVVTSLEVVSAAEQATEVHAETSLARLALGPTGVLSALEWERNAAGIYMLGQEEEFVLEFEDPVEAAGLTDDAITVFRDAVERHGDTAVESYAPAFEAMEGLEELRAEVAATPEASRSLGNMESTAAVFDAYTEIRDALVVANRQVALSLGDPELRQGAELVELNGQQTNLVAVLVRDQLMAAFGNEANGLDTPEEISTVARNLSDMRDNWDRMVSGGGGRYAPLVEDLLAAEEVQRFPQVIEESLQTGDVNVADVITYAANDDPETLAYTVFARQVEDIVRERSAELEDAATARQRWFGVLAVVAVVLAASATWLVSRSITKPLRSLTRQAKDMAERRLPDAVTDILNTPLGEDVSVPTVEPVSVNTRDEVADVAVALNTVQDTALDLAVEQAVLRRNIADSFVNLGRRNQNLLGRQLDFITELETNETNPDTLANLFRLDHLATRMRRNAESLLVLAGIEPPRKWAAPVRLTDVIRAALGEVEDYQRVTVRGVEPATIIGNAAADLAHLLAELIENALVFSPPDQTVDIRGRNRPDPHRSRPDSDTTERDQYGPGYTLAVIDSGLGMPTTDITAANRRLAGAESFTIAPSKYLGHYVAGNLAARHNITVHLDNSPGNGITATIDLPPTLLTTDTGTAPGPDGPASRDHALAGPPTAAALPGGNGSAHLAPAGARPPAPAPPRLDPAPPRPADAPPADAPWPATAAPQREPAPAAPSVTAAPPLAARAPGDPTEPPPGRTPSGLVKRSPRAPAAGEPARAASNAADDSLLASLSQYARGRGLGHPTAPAPPPAAPPAPPPAAPAPRPAPMPGPPPGLTRRVRGAQLPTTSPVPLRRGPEPAPGRPLRYVQPADDVYRFLTDFTAGVRRGLDDMNQGRSA